MKKILAIATLGLAAAFAGQTVEGQKLVQSSLVTWTTGANTGKTRIRVYSPDSTDPGIYLDTSSTGQAGSWKLISGTADSCSQPFLLAADSNGMTRPVWENRLWQVVKLAGDSSTFTYRIQSRERVYNNATKKTQWTPWTRAGINVGYTDIAVLDTVIIPSSGSGSKVSQYKLFQVAGTQARLCPASLTQTGRSVGDSTIIDSIRVYTR